MDAGIDFGMVFDALGHAPEPIHFGQQHRQGTGFAQHGQHARGAHLHQPAGEFLPDTFGHQMVCFAGLHHLLHQRQGGGRDGEVGPAGGKAGHAQDAHRVFGKGRGDMAQDPGLQVFAAAPRVDQGRAVGVEAAVVIHLTHRQRHGVDG